MYLDREAKITLLGRLEDYDSHKFSLKRSNAFMYYWKHYNMTVRCSFKLGLVGVVLGSISILFGVASFFV